MKEYGGKLLGSFFISSSEKYGRTGSRVTGRMGLNNRWKQDSYPLGSIDRQATAGNVRDKNAKDSDENILVTSSIQITHLDAADNNSRRVRDFDMENAEDIAKRVKIYTK